LEQINKELVHLDKMSFKAASIFATLCLLSAGMPWTCRAKEHHAQPGQSSGQTAAMRETLFTPVKARKVPGMTAPIFRTF
jgi:hypothetical protein